MILSCHSNSSPTRLPWATSHREISVHMNGTTNVAVYSLLINLGSLLKLIEDPFRVRDGNCLELTSWLLWSQLLSCSQAECSSMIPLVWHTKVADTYRNVKLDMWINNWPFPHFSVTTGSTKEERQISKGSLCMQKAIKFWYCLKFKKGYRYYNEKDDLPFTKNTYLFFTKNTYFSEKITYFSQRGNLLLFFLAILRAGLIRKWFWSWFWNVDKE